MLRALKDLIDIAVQATDGEIGKVRNFLFDDQSWTIRYLVVDVGGWLARRDVVIAVSAVDQPDWDKRTIRTNLTKEQVRHSPDVDSKKPVSRQQEIAMREYYGWAADWNDALFPLPSLPAGQKFPVHTEEEQHLRSTDHLTGYQVWSRHGDIGRLESFIMDEGTWHIGYLDVKMGDWLKGRSMLVPTAWLSSVSWAEHRVILVHEDSAPPHSSI